MLNYERTLAGVENREKSDVRFAFGFRKFFSLRKKFKITNTEDSELSREKGCHNTLLFSWTDLTWGRPANYKC